jgi:hypothetical protein
MRKIERLEAETLSKQTILEQVGTDNFAVWALFKVISLQTVETREGWVGEFTGAGARGTSEQIVEKDG